MIVLGFILVFIIGIIIGAGVICVTKAAQKTDIEIMLLELMDQLKKDRKEADKKMLGKTGKNFYYGIYLQANNTINLIKKLYGGIC